MSLPIEAHGSVANGIVTAEKAQKRKSIHHESGSSKKKRKHVHREADSPPHPPDEDTLTRHRKEQRKDRKYAAVQELDESRPTTAFSPVLEIADEEVSVPKKKKKRSTELLEQNDQTRSKKRPPEVSAVDAAEEDKPAKKKKRHAPIDHPQPQDSIKPISPLSPIPDSAAEVGYPATAYPLESNLHPDHDNASTGEALESSKPISELPSPFRSIRLSLYVPLYAISLTTATQSLLSTHLAPILLTYYPPAQGVVLAFSEPSISTRAPQAPSQPLQPPSQPLANASPSEHQALSGDEHGASWVWLTVTLLVFRPQRNAEMEGHINICSEGFIGLVLYNYFQTGIARSRIPKSWRWNVGHGDEMRKKKIRKGKKEKIKDPESSPPIQSSMTLDADDHEGDEEQEQEEINFFTDPDNNPIRGPLRFRVVDSEIVPLSSSSHHHTTSGRERWALQIEGTLLDAEEEEMMREEERRNWERIQGKSRTHRTIPAREEDSTHEETTLVSGGLRRKEEEGSNDLEPHRQSSLTMRTSGKNKHRVTY